MSMLTLVGGVPLAHALGWTLIHFCWQGAVVGLALYCVLGVVRESSRLRYAACCGALAVMVLLPIATFVRLAMEPTGSGYLILRSGGSSWALAPFAGGTGGSSSPWIDEATALLNRWVPWLLGFWVAGVLLLLGRLNLGLIAVRRMKAEAVQAIPSELHAMTQQLCERLGVRRPVRLMHSARVQAPTVIGWLRPAILIPVACLTGLSAGQIEMVLAHELAHVRRHDYLVSIVQSVVESLLFYHPATWWVSRQLRRERELCCDDLAVEVCGDKFAYAKALTVIEARRAAVPMAALGANGGFLSMRIKRLLGQSDSPAPRFTALAVLGVVLVSAVLCVGSAVRAQSHATAKQSTQVLSRNYLRWVNQDVRWIIIPAERKAFLSLKDDEERDHFIQQFWERRNPPGAAPGTFRREYYRRIAFANEHFGGKLPGWETDRGHIYIVYGPPDAIATSPSTGELNAKPYETWHYREIREHGSPVRVRGTHDYKAEVITRKDADFTFVDTCGCGEYKLETSAISAR